MLENVKELYENRLGENLLYMARVGSFQYGTNTDRSGYDFVMVYEKLFNKSNDNFKIRDNLNFEREVEIKVVSLWSYLNSLSIGYAPFVEYLMSSVNFVSPEFYNFYRNRYYLISKNKEGYTKSLKGEFYGFKKSYQKPELTKGSGLYYIYKYGYNSKKLYLSYINYLKMVNLMKFEKFANILDFSVLETIMGKKIKDGMFSKEESLEFFEYMEDTVNYVRKMYLNTFSKGDENNLRDEMNDYFNIKSVE